MSSQEAQEQPPATKHEAQDTTRGWIWFITGPTACGKTTIAKSLAQSLGFTFAEGDDYHPPSNLEKMSRNQPLTDADRAAWLDALRADEAPRRVVTCSALKRRYRDLLRDGHHTPREQQFRIGFVLLDVPEDVLRQRARERKGHFAGEGLVESQLRDLELPGEEETDVLVVKVGRENGVEDTLREVIERVRVKMES
ncbi:P-loop containing nucleoside triphosphate hydrolase protein [Achaetomium macrosporum]|uniref:Gluconokinase n=1 Tax=Achaetomium macrosporum TaxID=79813 RepID=A0AAN7CA18_9PEZI|nr:P-loop containing nucleoside triphosphate hydrolase protein [Achaetomium macrosporum]